MEKRFDVFRNDEAVGTATLTTMGLYYQIQCCCTLPEGSMQRLYVSTEHGTQMLGLLFPEEERFALQTKIPIQRLGQGSIRFYLEGQGEQKRKYVLDANKPYGDLPALERCRFALIDGKPYLVIRE